MREILMPEELEITELELHLENPGQIYNESLSGLSTVFDTALRKWVGFVGFAAIDRNDFVAAQKVEAFFAALDGRRNYFMLPIMRNSVDKVTPLYLRYNNGLLEESPLGGGTYGEGCYFTDDFDPDDEASTKRLYLITQILGSELFVEPNRQGLIDSIVAREGDGGAGTPIQANIGNDLKMAVRASGDSIIESLRTPDSWGGWGMKFEEHYLVGS